MKKESGRPILLKGKKVFVSAAIATLLVQPLYIPLSSGAAFAATDIETSQISEPEASVNATASEKPGFIDVVGRVKGENITLTSHRLEINTPDESTINPTPTPDASPEDDNTYTYSYELDTSDYSRGIFEINYTATYTTGVDDATTGESSANTIFNTAPTATLESPQLEANNLIRSNNFTLRIIGNTPLAGDEITNIDARFTKEGEESPRLVHQSEKDASPSILERAISLEDGIYYLTYQSFTRSGESVRQSLAITVDENGPSTPQITTPDTNLRGVNFANISWNPSTDVASQVVDYYVSYTFTRGGVTEATITEATDAPNYRIDLEGAGSVDVRVQAEDSVGNLSDWSNALTILFNTATLSEDNDNQGGSNQNGDDDTTGNDIINDDTTNGMRNEDEDTEGDDENSEDDEDITETALGVASFSTGLVGNADPFFTEIIGGRTIPVDNGNDSSNEEENSIKAPTAGDVINKNETDEKGVAKFLSIAWYWWVAMIAGATSLWSLVIAGRNRTTGGDL